MRNKEFKEYKIYLCRKLASKWMCKHCINKQCNKKKAKLDYQYNFEQQEKLGLL